MRAWLCVLVLSVAGCAGKKPMPGPASPVRVKSMLIDFPGRDRGRLEFTLVLPPNAPKPRSVTWQLFLDGVRFAAGVEQLGAEVTGPELQLKSALVSRHLAWREGEAPLEVGLKGEVDVGSARLEFRERREVVVQGRPLWNGAE